MMENNNKSTLNGGVNASIELKGRQLLKIVF